MRRLLTLMCGVGLMAACGGGTDTGDPPFTTTTTSTSTSVVTAATTDVTVEVVEPEACRVESSAGPTLRSLPVDGSVHSLDVSGNCIVAVVTGGELLTLADDALVPMGAQLPFDRPMGVVFVGEALWVNVRSGDCFGWGVLDGESWHEIVEPACGDEGGLGPIGVTDSRVIFARAPMGELGDPSEVEMDLVVYEEGVWTEFGTVTGIPYGAVIDGDGEIWVVLWSGGLARCNRESCIYQHVPGAVTSSQIYGMKSGPDGDVWLLARNALARFDGAEWTAFSSASVIETWGQALEETVDQVVQVTLVDLEGLPLDPQPDFFGGLGQPFDFDITSEDQLWIGVRLDLMEGAGDSLVHVSGDTWTLHPLDNSDIDIVPEMVAAANSTVWFAHYNRFGDETGEMAQPHVYWYTPPEK